MRAGLRLAGVSITFCLAGLAFATMAFGISSTEGSPLGTLVVPGVQVLDGGQQLREQEEARLSSPEAVAEREVSRTAYENLGAEQARGVDAQAFPGMVYHPAGGPPSLPAGQSIAGFLSDNAAQVNLGGGARGVVESAEPIATVSASGQRVPIDLDLKEAVGGFAPSVAAASVSIPKRLSAGVQLVGAGISLTPITTGGSPLEGSEGTLDGAAVVYSNTQTDLDTLIKPTATGFAVDSLLRSVQSPEQLAFSVGLPAGASLAHAHEGSEAVDVLADGSVIAVVAAPSAQDANGTPVPVSMSVSGDVLTVSVALGSGAYRYPVEVDPEVRDSTLGASPYYTNWRFEHFGKRFMGLKQYLAPGNLLLVIRTRPMNGGR